MTKHFFSVSKPYQVQHFPSELIHFLLKSAISSQCLISTRALLLHPSPTVQDRAMASDWLEFAWATLWSEILGAWYYSKVGQIQGKLWTWMVWAWSQGSYGSEPDVPARARHLGREVMPNPPPEQRGLRLKQSPSPTNRASGIQDQVNRESAKGVKCGTSGGSWEEHQQSLCPSLVYEPSPPL